MIYEVGNSQWNIPKLRQFLEEIVPRNSFFDDFEVTHDFEGIGRRTMLLNARKLRTEEEDAPERILLAIDDITAGKQLEAVRRSEIRYRHLFEAAKNMTLLVESADDAIISTALDGIVTSWNRGAERIFGYTGKEIIGRPIVILVPPDHLDEASRILERIRDGEHIEHYETQRVKKDRTLVNVSLSVSPIRDEHGNIIGASRILRDITERRQAEEERKQLLAREQAARQEAEAANRAKDEFLTTVSHELRTPLNAILGWSTLLRTEKLEDAIAVRALEIIERNAKAQAQLIEDILDVSRVITGKLRLDVRPVDLAPVIDAAIDTVRPASEAKTIQIQTHCGAGVGVVSGDPDRLQQVVWNLLSNAVKFTPNGGRVDVRLERLDSDVQITVSDTGNGIRADFLPLIFDRFRQADSTSTRKYGGLGLGLAIVRQIVELHGGTVHAESRGEGQGATFRVRLPIINIAGKGEPRGGLAFPILTKVPPFACPPQIYGVRVLLVEDQPDV